LVLFVAIKRWLKMAESSKEAINSEGIGEFSD
jgi:hypothetical protein